MPPAMPQRKPGAIGSTSTTGPIRRPCRDAPTWTGSRRSTMAWKTAASSCRISPSSRSASNAPDETCFEVLLRMRGEDGAEILPDVFLPIAERFDLSSKIDVGGVEPAVSVRARQVSDRPPRLVCHQYFAAIHQRSRFHRFPARSAEEQRVAAGAHLFRAHRSLGVVERHGCAPVHRSAADRAAGSLSTISGTAGRRSPA